jgi:peptidoglycan L-alanyl-D-glutamate endopeptidase CwlK
MFSYGPASMAILKTLTPDLQKVALLAIKISKVDFRLIEGVRTEARQHELWGKGRTAAECKAVGVDPKHARPDLKKVTWTLKSKHFAGPDGKSRALDFLPAPYDWEDVSHFDAVADAFLEAGRQLGIKIRHGADWDMDLVRREKGEGDNPHIELA